MALFEIGTIFNAKREEFKKVSFIYSGDKEAEDISNHGKPTSMTFFEFAQKVLNCVGQFEIQPMKNIPNDFIHPYQSGLILMNQKEDISIRYYLTDKVHAPVRENTRLGIMKCYLGDEVIREFPLVATKTIAKRTLKTCFDYAILKYINKTD